MIALALLVAVQDSREVEASGGAIEIRVPVSAEGRHPATVVSFPEEALEALVAGWNEGDLSVERRRENLFLKLLRPVEGDLHVLGASGALYRLAVRPAAGAYDGHVRIVRPAPRGSRGVPEPVELLRAMRLGRRPPEGAVWKADAPLEGPPELSLRLAWVYDTASFRGYVLRARNVAGGTRRLDPSRFAGRDLVLAGAREMVLGPGKETLLYFVFWKAP